LRLFGLVSVSLFFYAASLVSPDAMIGGCGAPEWSFSTIFAFRLQNRDLRFTCGRASLPNCNMVAEVRHK